MAAPQTPQPNLEFDHIPQLRELLPQFRGWPGYVYLQVCVHNRRRAQSENWSQIHNSLTYTIRGPKGSVDCDLWVSGKRIPGQDPMSGRRRCYVDRDVTRLTGLRITPDQEDSDGAREVDVSAGEGEGAGPQLTGGPSQDRKDDARVQGGNAA